MANYTIKIHLDVIQRMLEADADAACKAVEGIAVDAVLDQMLYGYSTPHGPDGHTEIVDTGRLYNSITSDSRKVSSHVWEVTVGASSQAGRMEDVGYVDYVHNGTARLEARPFITDALTDQETQTEIKRAFTSNLKRGFT